LEPAEEQAAGDATQLAPQNEGGTVPSQNRGFDPQLLTRHFDEHGGEFTPPFTNENEYEQAAINFMNEPLSSGVYQGVRTNGDILRFNEATNAFGIMRADGLIRTYFIPDPTIHSMPTNWDYVLSQIW
jgi:pyocin large subunit-like protein